MNALELRTALALAAVYLFRMLGLFMVLPVIAVSATSFADYSPLYVGFAVGAYGLTQAVLQIPMGALSDRWGRKPVIFIGLTVFAIGSVVAAQADSMAALVIGRFLQGGGAIASAIMALATDVSREKARAYVMAIIGIAIGFSFYLAVLIGPMITASYGLSGIFWFTAVTAIISIPLVVVLVPNPVKSIASAELVPRRASVERLATASQLWRLNVNILLLHLCITLLFVPLPGMLIENGLALEGHWQVYLPVLLIAIIGLAVLMTLARKGKEKTAIAISCLGMAFGLVILAIIPASIAVLSVAAVLFFSGFNYLEATFPTMVARIAPAGEKGSAMGVYASFQFIGAFFGGIIAGGILSWTSEQYVFACGVVLSIVMLLVSAKLRPAPKVFRVTLAVESAPRSPEGILASLLKLEGVVEAKWAHQQSAIHLKTTDEFDINQASQLL